MDWSRIRRVFHMGSFRPDPEREVDDELRFHFERTVEELVESGMSPEEARREAERRFGDVAAYRADLEERERTRQPGPLTRWAVALGEAVTFALLRIRRNPGFSTAVIATLALGIGANVAMFRIVDRLMLSPPEHIVEADQVRKVYLSTTRGKNASTGSAFPFPDFRDLSSVEGFQELAAYTPGRGVLGSGIDSEEIRLTVVSASFFPLLGVSPAIGRFFSPEDDRVGAPGTIVLSGQFWERRFGSDRGVLGESVEIDGRSYTVVGVAPSGFTGVDLRPVDAWVPIEVRADDNFGGEWRENRRSYWLRMVARLAPGVSPESAEEEATSVYRAAWNEEQRTESNNRIVTGSIVPSEDVNARSEIDVARWLGAVSFLVLLIACANVANLFLARDLRRRRELALQTALGVGRRRLVGQLMAEAGLLAVVGGCIAVTLAHWGGGVVGRLLLPNMSVAGSPWDGRLLTFTGLAVGFATVVAGVIPALQWRRTDLTGSLKSGGQRTATPRTRTQAGLLVLQAALSVVLLAGAGLFVRSLSNIEAIDLGFDSRGLALVELDIEGTQNPGVLPVGDSIHDDPTWPPSEEARIYEEATRRLSALPGMEGASLALPAPFTWTILLPFDVPGRESLSIEFLEGPFPTAVESGFFDLMGIEIVRGRGIEPADDRPGAEPVMVVNERMAERIWPGEKALGRCAHLSAPGDPCVTVVGIVANANRESIVEDVAPLTYYVPIRRQLLQGVAPSIVARSDGIDAAAVRAAALSASPRIRFADVRTFEDVVAPELRPWRLGAAVFSAFGLLALLVSAVGLYSVLSFDVAGRTREMGIRSALGAHSRALLGIVARRTLMVVGIGVALGVGVVVTAGSRLDPLLYEVSARDPSILLAVATALGAVACAATVVPAIRAIRVDPVQVLRAE